MTKRTAGLPPPNYQKGSKLNLGLSNPNNAEAVGVIGSVVEPVSKRKSPEMAPLIGQANANNAEAVGVNDSVAQPVKKRKVTGSIPPGADTTSQWLNQCLDMSGKLTGKVIPDENLSLKVKPPSSPLSAVKVASNSEGTKKKVAQVRKKAAQAARKKAGADKPKRKKQLSVISSSDDDGERSSDDDDSDPKRDKENQTGQHQQGGHTASYSQSEPSTTTLKFPVHSKSLNEAVKALARRASTVKAASPSTSGDGVVTGSLDDTALFLAHSAFVKPGENFATPKSYALFLLSKLIADNPGIHSKTVLSKQISAFKNSNNSINDFCRKFVLEQTNITPGHSLSRDQLTQLLQKVDLDAASLAFLGKRSRKKRTTAFSVEHLSTMMFRISVYVSRKLPVPVKIVTTKGKEKTVYFNLSKKEQMGLNEIRFYSRAAAPNEPFKTAYDVASSEVFQQSLGSSVQAWKTPAPV